MNQSSGQRTPMLSYSGETEAKADPVMYDNGRKILFSRLVGGKWRLSTNAIGNSAVVDLFTANGSNCEQPVPYFYSSTDVFYVSDADGNKEIYLYDSNLGGSSKITNTPVGVSNTNPVVSPNGAWLAYQSNKDGNNEIYVRNLVVPSEFRMTNNAADDVEPSFSPNDLNIVFSSNRSGNYEIYRALFRAGTLVTQLTNHVNNDREPVYSPDGSKVFFTTDRDDQAAPVSTEIYSMTNSGASPARVPVDSSYNQKAPYIATIFSPSMLGMGLLSTCSGIIVGHNNMTMTSFLQFDITSASDANRGLTRITSETLPNPSVSVIYYTISSPTPLSSIAYTRPSIGIIPGVVEWLADGNSTNALITYATNGTNIGQVLNVLPYSANRSGLKKRTEGNLTILEGELSAVLDSQGKNLAPTGASEVRIDSNGALVSWK